MPTPFQQSPAPPSPPKYRTPEERLRALTSFVNGSHARREVMMYLSNGPASASKLSEKLNLKPVRVVTRALKELREKGLADPAPGPPTKGRLWYSSEDGHEVGMRIAKLGR